MIIICIVLYVILNIYIVVRYYRRGIEVFSPPVLMGVMSLTQLLPQLTTIYFHPYYNNTLLYNLLFVMLSSNIALVVGYEKGIVSSLPSKPIWDFKIKKMDIPIFVLVLLGTLATFMFSGEVRNADWVIASQFEAMGIIGLSLGLVKSYKGYASKLLRISLVVGTVPLVIFAFFIKGSRNNAFLLLVMWLLFFALKYPQYKKLLSKLFLIIFLCGGIASLSIVDIRNEVHENNDFVNYTKIDYWENFKQAFTNSYTPVGMDLGNAAEGIDHCYKNNEYNYGTFLWNGFVFNYVPRRIVGEEQKEELMSDLQNMKVVDQLCNGVTCMTGYYDAFSAFSYFGFVVFLILGYFYGRIFVLSQYSSFYLFLYIYILNSSAIVMTHGIQLMMGKVEFFFIFILPLLYFYISKRMIK